MHEADAEVSNSFLEGYSKVRDLDGNYLELLEALTLATVLWVWSDSVRSRTAFAELPSFVRCEFRKFLSGERFLFGEDRTWL